MQKQKLIHILHQMAEDEFNPDNVHRLLANGAAMQSLEVFIPNTNNAFINNEGEGLTNIRPLITEMNDESGKNTMCLHVFLDESIGKECIPNHLTKDISILKNTFGWASLALPEIVVHQNSSCMIMLHHSETLNHPEYESPIILSPINLLNIAKVLYANPHALMPEHTVQMWNMISAKELKQYSYQFASEHMLINRLWLFAEGTSIYIVVDGGLSNDQWQILQSDLQVLLAKQLGDNFKIPLSIVVEDYKSSEAWIKDVVSRYGCLVFDREKPQGAIKRWFNVRRQLSVVVDSNFIE